MDSGIAHRILTVLTVLVSSAVVADDEERFKAVAQTLQERYPSLKILEVRMSPMPAVYEVFTGTDLFYTDGNANYLIHGSIIDTRTKKDLSSGLLDERNRIDFNKLPLRHAIVITKGKGTRKLAVFTDPDCPYCRNLEKELVHVDNVTVYSFLFPLVEIHPQAPARSTSIWCAEDRVRAWLEWMLEKKEPAANECDDNPVAALQALGKELYVNATPTLYFESGRRVTGGMAAADLDKALNEEGGSARR